MDIFSKIFKSDKEGIRRSHVKNLISVALADGNLSKEEWNLLVYLAEKFEMSESQILEIRDNPDTVDFVAPKTYEESALQIEDLIMVMTIDREIDPTEVTLIKRIALKLNILPQMVDDIISRIQGM